MRTFNDIKIGDIVIAYDEYSHDYNEHTIQINSVEYDKEYVTESNPDGMICYGTNLEKEEWGDDYITFVHEGNFVCITDCIFEHEDLNVITKDMIKIGFEKGIISIENEFAGCISLCCKIGDNAFYFVGMEDENLTTTEYWKSYTLDMTIDMIYEILKDVKSAEDSGLDEGEWEYYKALLEVDIKEN